MDPIIDAILLSEDATRAGPIKTYRRPDGVHVPTRIIPLLADLGGAREAGGFLSHAANCFCSYCKLHRNDKENLDIQSWPRRTKEEVREQIKEWEKAIFKKDQKKLATDTGVRGGASLQRLWYWDPVWHIILGYLHNWLEGVLQHQLRELWGIGRKSTEKGDKNEQDTDYEQDTDHEQDTDDDLPESADESEDLENEQTESESEEEESIEEDESASTPRATPARDSDSTPHATPARDVVPPAPAKKPGRPTTFSFTFKKEELEAIRECIRNISLPTWASRPPSNLGEKRHGKLKADQYLILFTAILPLILPAIFVKRKAQDELESFYDLTACTNIVVSFKTSNSEADQHTKHYTAYRQSIQQLFPEFQSKPNHHYAGHDAEILKYWGPLPGLSEFPGERMNGRLQKVKTNKHLCTYFPFFAEWNDLLISFLDDMDYTMLQQMSRLVYFLAFLHHKASSNPEMDIFANILEPSNITKGPTIKPIDDFEQAIYLTKTLDLDETEYDMILQYLNLTGHHGQWSSNTAYPHPEHALILPPFAKRCTEFHENGHTYSCSSSHEGNSFIEFYDRRIQGHWTGVINHIFEIPLQGFLRKFIFVSPHRELEQSALVGTPYDPLLYPRFMSKIVEVKPSEDMVVLEPEHIITHLTTYKTRGDIYGIRREVLLVCWALNRGRKEYVAT
jgi:hypothetical protein